MTETDYAVTKEVMEQGHDYEDYVAIMAEEYPANTVVSLELFYELRAEI